MRPRKEITIKITRTSKTAKIPEYKTSGSNACDLCADFEEDFIKIPPYSTVIVPTGIKIELPKSYAALVLPRSGVSSTTPLRIANAPGLIDSDYRGNIGIIVDNISSGYLTIHKGDRIAQLLIIKTDRCRFQEEVELSETDRGENGFGSTGTNNESNKS